MSQALSASGHSVNPLSRHSDLQESLRGADVVVHLAGEPVAQRWTPEAKRRIRDSRVTGTRNLVQAMAHLPQKPAALICASAIGYYGSRGDEILTEASGAGSGFLPEVCVEWEKEACAAKALGMRVALVRTGVALDPHGGALGQMLTPFRFGAGGRLGDGKQWMSWIHLDDLAALYCFAVEHPVSGAINGVAPQPVINSDFTKALAGALRRPAIIPVPGFALRMLFGEMAGVLLESQRVLPERAETERFRFRFPDVGEALADLLG